MPVTVQEILAAKTSESSHPAALILLQKMLEAKDIAPYMNKDHELDNMLNNIVEGLSKGNVRYLLGRFAEHPEAQKKVREFLGANEKNAIVKDANTHVVTAIGEAYLDADKHFHAGVLPAIYQELQLERVRDAKIDMDNDPFFKVGAALMKKTRKELTNEEVADLMGEPHAKIFFAISCQAGVEKKPKGAVLEKLFQLWRSFSEGRYAFELAHLSSRDAFVEPKGVRAAKPAVHKVKEGNTKAFVENRYKEAYKTHKESPAYKGVNEQSWQDLLAEVERRQGEVKSRGSVAYDFDALKDLLPDAKLPAGLAGKIHLPNDLIEKLDNKLAIELQKAEFRKPKSGGRG